ncbi:MAG: J domain-containing protein [Methanospirillum sp.]|nr:J domain-containing protein [Methanospirillum sp.]
MATITAEALRSAADLLGIGEEASLNEIRSRYHGAIRTWHPDVSGEDPEVSHEMTVRLTAAYDLLSGYCLNRPVSFRPGDLARDLEAAPADYWTERFGQDPIWG